MSEFDFTLRIDFDRHRFWSDVRPHRIGGLLIWWTGYLANEAELCQRLQASGPTEIIALSYQHWGSRLSEHVEGEFALVVVDPSEKIVSLCHDELGLVPLFYRVEGNAVECGTNLVSLTEASALSDIDEDYVADILVGGDHQGARTAFVDIRRLTTGQAGEWRSGHMRMVDCATLLHDEDTIADDAGAIDERFRELLFRSTGAALGEADSALCELSGGLDSSTVFGAANQLSPGGVRPVSTIYSLSKSADESKWIGMMVARYRSQALLIDGDVYSHCSQLPFERHAEPGLLMGKAAWHRAYLQIVSDSGCTTVLTGEGGDAVLFGDVPLPHYLADLLLRGRACDLWQEAETWGSGERGERSALYALARYAAVPAKRFVLKQRLFTVSEAAPWLSRDYAQSVGARKRNLALRDMRRVSSVARASRLQNILVSARNAATFYRMLAKDFAFRHPLMNRALVRFMLALPHNQRFEPGADRIVQRRAMADIVAPEILARQTKGGSAEPWIRGLEDHDVWPDVLTADPLLVNRGYFNRDLWFAAVDQARVGRFTAKKFFDSAMAMEAWLQMDQGWRAGRTAADRWRDVVGFEEAF